MAFKLQERRRESIIPSIALIGASGSGKTKSAIRLARGLTGNGRVTIIDTENKRSAFYADDWKPWRFKAIDLRPDFTPERYINAAEQAIEDGCEALIIDQISFEWAGTGGILEQVGEAEEKNAFSKWRVPSKIHKEFVDYLTGIKVPNIITMRAKEQYEMIVDEKGRMTPKKMGLGPIQRDGIEYEFPFVFLLNYAHAATVTKDNSGLFGDITIDMLAEEHGKKIIQWARGVGNGAGKEKRKKRGR